MNAGPPAAASAPALLQVDGLHFGYAGRPLFAGFSARFDTGLCWLRGRNGSGKSTLLKLFGGVLAPAAGRLAVRGIDAAAAPLDYRREVFWCGPGEIAFGHLLPGEFLGFIASLYPRFDRTAAEGHVDAFGLRPHLGSRIEALSTGSQRKLWVSAALACGATAVLLDEPLDTLDAASREVLQARLAQCASAHAQAWIVVSHERLGAAAEGAARVIELPST